ncbi:MAG: SDR family NAD(P)-dependent oxidoreductase [Candidatus Cloacimonetes bacterium]|nr:SDR family NAD(P)-dependent oxidoreductase [Candidatus Cloacimonadota bacterium]
MNKTILITGASDGIGLETAKSLISQGHNVLLHGRNPNKLANVLNDLSKLSDEAILETYIADLSDLNQVQKLIEDISETHDLLDVIINNAGVFSGPDNILENGLDIRFVVNTIAPYLLTKGLLHLLPSNGRVVNLSSAAQAPVDLDALLGKLKLEDYPAYAQSKLAIVMWSNCLALQLKDTDSVVTSINPGSLLASKMVKDNFGVEGGDLKIGADILVRAAVSEEFENKSGSYFDNDAKYFSDPHPDALDLYKSKEIVDAIEEVISKLVK